jgi:hypothetical protein
LRGGIVNRDDDLLAGFYPVGSCGSFSIKQDSAFSQKAVQGRKGQAGQAFADNPIQSAAVIVCGGTKGDCHVIHSSIPLAKSP